MSTLRDRIVWITGAGSGIGRAIAIGFAAAGALGDPMRTRSQKDRSRTGMAEQATCERGERVFP